MSLLTHPITALLPTLRNHIFLWKTDHVAFFVFSIRFALKFGFSQSLPIGWAGRNRGGSIGLF